MSYKDEFGFERGNFWYGDGGGDAIMSYFSESEREGLIFDPI